MIRDHQQPRLIYVILLLCLCWTMSSQAELLYDQKRVSGSEPEKIRAAYLHLTPPEKGEQRLRRLDEYGFNTALVAHRTYRLQSDLWKAWGRLAANYNIQLFPVLNFAVPKEFTEQQGRYRPYTNRAGKILQATPCPLDQHYWNTVIGERFEQFAELSNLVPLTGALFDTEMYGSELSLYYEHCYCDFCWQEFIGSVPLFDHLDVWELPAEKRFDYLREQHIFQQYQHFQWKQLQTLLSQIETLVHQVNPIFRIGFLGYRHTWFFIALVHGLGTPDNPVQVFSESSYVRGYTPYVDRERDRVMGAMTNAQYIPGLWLHRFFPGDIPAQLFDLSIHTDGYWIYPADSLWTEGNTSGVRSLHGNRQDYWKSIRQANNELLRLAGETDSFTRRISPVHRSSFYDASSNRLFTAPALKQLLTHIFSGRENLVPVGQQTTQADTQKAGSMSGIPAENVYREKTLFHAFKLKGQNASIQITHVPVSQQPESSISYRLFDHTGTSLQEGQVTYDERSTTITFPVDTFGHISLMTDSGIHAVRVTFQNLPYLVEASSTFPLSTLRTTQNYAVYVEPGQQWLKLRAYCPEGEFASLTVKAPDDSVQSTLRVLGALYGFFEMQIPLSVSPYLPQKAGKTNKSFQDIKNFWRIAVTPIPSQPFAHVRFYLYDEKFPYLWETPYLIPG